MTEQDKAVIVANLIQRISKLEAKNQVNEFLIQLLLQKTDLNKNIPILEKIAKDIFNLSGSTDIYEELQIRLMNLQGFSHNRVDLQEKSLKLF